MFLGYPLVSPDPKLFYKSFLENEIESDIWIHVLAYLTFACAIYFFISAKSMDKLGLKKRLLFYKYIDNIDNRKKKETIFERGILRFRKVARRYIALSRTFKPEKINLNSQIFKMPMFRFYCLCLVLWAYAYYLTYFVMINNGHFDKTHDGFFDRYYCFYNFGEKCFSK